MANRVTVTEERRGAMLGPGVTAKTRGAMRVSLDRLFNKGWQFARIIAPVLTGRYRASLAYETHITDYGAEGTMFSRDNPPKVRVIEYGFPPARPELRGRAPRLVFKGAADHMEQLIRAHDLQIEAELIRGLE